MRRIILSSVPSVAVPYCHLCRLWLCHIVICAVCGCAILSSAPSVAVPYCHLCRLWLCHIVICAVCGCAILSSVPSVAVPYCHLRRLWLCHIFPHYLINDKISEKELLNIKRVLFSPHLLSKICLILRRTERHVIKNMCWYSCKVPIVIVRF